MKLRQLYSDIIFSSPEQGMQELMRGILARTNFVPGVRHVIIFGACGPKWRAIHVGQNLDEGGGGGQRVGPDLCKDKIRREGTQKRKDYSIKDEVISK